MAIMSTLQTLIVDDSASARVVLKRLLEKSGIQVHLSCSGSEALNFLKNHSPDLIFMDHTMPGMDGLEATKAITSNPKTASIPVVMYTSNDEEGYFENAKEHGAIGVVSKPVSTEKLFSVLTNLFTLHSNQQETLNQRFNQRLDRLYSEIETLVETKLAESQHQLEEQLQQNQRTASPQKNREILPLIHTIADSKIHQLNIELRNHMSAKLDVMSQDIRDDNLYHNQQLLGEFRSQLPEFQSHLPDRTNLDFSQRLHASLSPKAILTSASNMIVSPNFYLGILITLCAYFISL